MKIFNKTLITVLSLSVLVVPALMSASDLYRTLRVGARGADVSTLQSFLSNDSSIYPSGLVTGYFGGLTRSGVIRFQGVNGLGVDGIVGPNTRAVVNAQMNGGTYVSNSPTIQQAPGFTTGVTLTESNSVVTFNVNTDVATRATVYYSTTALSATENLNVNPVTVAISGTGVQANTNLQTNHNVATLALQSNTMYYAMVVVTDINGVVSVQKVAPFRTK